MRANNMCQGSSQKLAPCTRTLGQERRMTKQEAIRLATQHATAVLHPFSFKADPVHVAFHAPSAETMMQ